MHLLALLLYNDQCGLNSPMEDHTFSVCPSNKQPLPLVRKDCCNSILSLPTLTVARSGRLKDFTPTSIEAIEEVITNRDSFPAHGLNLPLGNGETCRYTSLHLLH
jgi:hypothetical protein